MSLHTGTSTRNQTIEAERITEGVRPAPGGAWRGIMAHLSERRATREGTRPNYWLSLRHHRSAGRQDACHFASPCEDKVV
jgi:hypothetical protein